MIVGVTASRRGMTLNQLDELCEGLIALGATELHHGDCVGGDEQAHAIGRSLGLRIVGHPPDNPRLRAFCDCDELRPELPYMVRNRAIVTTCELLAGGPDRPRSPRSGTWLTIGYAERIGRPHVVLAR